MTLAWILAAALAAASPQPAAAPPATAAAPTADDFPALVVALERSALDGDTPALRQAGAGLRRWAAVAPPPRRPLAHYAVAYSAWRLAFMREVEAAERETLLAEAVKRLQEVLELEPRSAEAAALLSGVFGAQIAASPMRGMTLGQRAGAHLRSALEAEPHNPRVLMQQGVSAFHTPPMFGGSLEKAEAALRRSLALFEQEPVDRPWPNWGRFDAHVWLGQVLAKTGDRAGARREFEAALVLAPRSGWVRHVLLPRVAEGGAGDG